MRRTSAVQGMTLQKYFSPFYGNARGVLGLSPAVVDHCLSVRASASMDSRTVKLTEPDGTVWTGTFRIGRRQRAARWINQYNMRAQQDQLA